jgi:hypothetical protein
MSIKAPDDTAKTLETLIKASKQVLEDAPLHRKLLLHGAIIDAEDLLAELTGRERIDTHGEAMKAIFGEIRKVGKP